MQFIVRFIAMVSSCIPYKWPNCLTIPRHLSTWSWNCHRMLFEYILTIGRNGMVAFSLKTSFGNSSMWVLFGLISIFSPEKQKKMMIGILFTVFQTYFEKRGVEFTEWEPKDWRPSPKFLANIRDPNYKKFASDLNALWKKLGRKMIDDVSVSGWLAESQSIDAREVNRLNGFFFHFFRKIPTFIQSSMWKIQ